MRSRRRRRAARERVAERARPRAQVVLGDDVGRRAELARELDARRSRRLAAARRSLTRRAQRVDVRELLRRGHRRRIMPRRAHRPRPSRRPRSASTTGLAYALFAARAATPAGGGRDPPRRGLLQGVPLRLRPRRAAAAGLAAVALRRCAATARAAGALDGRAIDDVAGDRRRCCAARRAARAARVVAWAASWRSSPPSARGADAVVAICPASGDGLRRGLRAGRFDFPADSRRSRRCCAEHDDRGRGGRARRAACCSCTPRATRSCPVERSSRALHAAAPRQPARRGAGRPPPLGPARRRAAGRGAALRARACGCGARLDGARPATAPRRRRAWPCRVRSQSRRRSPSRG